MVVEQARPLRIARFETEGAGPPTVATILVVGVGADARTFGALVAIIGMGTILGATAVGKLGQRISRVQRVALGIGRCPVGVALLAMVGTVSTALTASFSLGLTVPAVFVPSQTLAQEETPSEMLGRVSSTSIALITVSHLIGVAASGKLAEWFGIRNLYYAVAAAVVLVGVVGYAYARAYHVGENQVSSTEPGSPGP